MELVRYTQLNDEILPLVCTGLIAGYDTAPVQLLQPSESYPRKNFSALCQYGVNIEDYNLTEQQIAKLLRYFPAGSLHEMDLLFKNGNDIIKYLDNDVISTTSIIEILNNYPQVDLTGFINSSFAVEDIINIADGYSTGIEPSFYEHPDFMASNKTLQPDVLKRIEPSDMSSLAELFPHLGTKQLKVVCELYTEVGNGIFKVAKENADMLNQSKESKYIETVLTAKYFDIPVPDEFQITPHHSKDEINNLISRFFEYIKQVAVERIMQVILQESQQKNINLDKEQIKHIKATLSDAEIFYLRTLMELVKNNAGIFYFVLFLQEDKHAFVDAVRWYYKTGVHPDNYPLLQKVTGEKTNLYDNLLSSYHRIFQEKVDDILGLKEHKNENEKSFTLNQLLLILQYHRMGADISYATPELDAEGMEIIFKYPEKAENILDGIKSIKYIAELDSDTTVYEILKSNLVELYAHYDINLFYCFSENYPLSQDRHRIINTFSYIITFLDAVRHKPDLLQNAKETAERLLSFTVLQDKYFNTKQMRQIHLGLIHNIDVEKYAKPEYSDEIMMVIRQGLEKGVDLTPFVNDNTEEEVELLSHILRILTGQAPVNPEMVRADNKLTDKEHPYFRAIDMLKTRGLLENHM